MMIKKKNTTITNEMRNLICKKYENGKTIREISEELEFNYYTLAAIIRKYKTKGIATSEKNKCGRKKLLNDEDGNMVRQIISSDVSTSLQEMKNTLEVNHNKHVSISTIHRMIQSFEYSFKRVQLIPIRRNQDNNKEVRFNYSRMMLEMDANKMIFIDEMGVNCSMRRRFGRAPKGETPKKNVTSIRSKNISIAAAITKTELLYFKIREGAYNTEHFVLFINDLIEKLRERYLSNMLIICDNVPFHKSVIINNIIAENGHKLIFLPPYSPQLNPIEEVFSSWKERIRSLNCENHDSLFQAIHNSSAHISSAQCEAYFRHMHSFLVKAITREDF